MLYPPGDLETLLRHESILASAGSGKTYQLTTRYLQLVAAGADPATILATTFSRLAAGEVRDKLLCRLADAASDEEKLDELRAALRQPSISAADVRHLLAALARQMDRLQIRTLDSFLAAIQKSFAMELGLPVGSAIVDEETSAALRSEAIDLMLDQGDPQPLIDLLRQLVRESSERSVINEINNTVTGLYTLWREAPAEAWECVPDLPRLAESELNAAIERLQHLSLPSHQRIAEAHAKSIEAALARRWDEFISGGYPKSMLAGNDTYYSKPIDSAVREAYRVLIDHAASMLIGPVRAQTLATRDLLAKFDAHYTALKRKAKALTFDDVTHVLAGMIDESLLADIAFRIDARVQHLLLDEFQDTSIVQWQAMRPFAEEIVSNRPPERSFFCVGDVKQSIYGWRSATPQVQEEIPNLLRGGDGSRAVEARTLSKSWRSAPVVIETVNAVFGSIETNVAIAEHTEVVEHWRKIFEPHATEKTKLPGYAELRTVRRPDKSKGETAENVRLRAAAELVAEIHRQSPHLTIGVLTRSNKTIGRLLYEFSADRLNVPASGAAGSGSPLTDSPAVEVILSALQLADHPGDTIAAFHVATSPLASVIGLVNHVSGERVSVARMIRRRLADEGYASVIAEWVAKLAPVCDERQMQRLVQLAELAQLHDAGGRASLRPGEFVALVESRDVANPQAAPIRVMTIHKSKGLEFDVVVLPELDKLLAGRPPGVVYERATATGPISRICRHMGKELVALVPQLQPVFEQTTYRTVRESLCVLYVAMTRARQGLYMLIDPPKENEKTLPKTMAGVLRNSLAPGVMDADALIWSAGDPDWITRSPAAAQPGEPRSRPAVTGVRLAKTSGRFTRGVAAAAPSGHTTQSLAAMLRLTPADARERGTAIHALLERVTWLDECDESDEELARVALHAVARKDLRWAMSRVREFRAMLKTASLKRLLSITPVERASVRLHREYPFARLVDGRVQLGSIDRLVVRHSSRGAAESAHIVDYKTDGVRTQTIEALASQYRSQVENYRAVVMEQFALPENRVRMTLAFVGGEDGVTFDL